MRRRSAAGRKPVKTRRKKAAAPKCGNSRKGTLRRNSHIAAQKIEVLRRRELKEALEQQAATSEVLQIISSSQGNLQPVFDAILANATRICEAKFGILLVSEGDAFRTVALHGAPRAYADARRREPVVRGPAATRAGSTRQPVQIADIRAEPAYTNDPQRFAILDLADARTMLAVPMLRDDTLVGTINIYRQEVRPFTEKQIKLVQNFAAQAVIAIENTRLLNELRERTADLTESLEQQTATSDVLRVISSSSGQLEPVFQSMLESATRICKAKLGALWLYEEGKFRPVALAANASPEWEAYIKQRGAFRPQPDQPLGQLVKTKAIVHASADTGGEAGIAAFRFGGARAFISVPMLKENELVGAINIFRQETREFTQKETALVTNFAAQAVIAIENTRLLSELRERTADLTESLEQQTATSDVLRIISSSPGELDPVFNAILENASRLCDARFGFLWLAEGDGFRPVAMHNVPPALAGRRRDQVIHFGPETPIGRLIETRRHVHVTDITSDPGYIKGFRPLRELADIGGARTLLSVPMLKDNELIGAFAIYRPEARPFTDKQIALVQNFAAQAVIAIENARLLNELRQRTGDLMEALEQQTTTADILGVISRSLKDTQPVFDAIVQSGVRLFPGAAVSIALVEAGMVKAAAVAESDPTRAELWRQRFPFPLTRQYMHSVAILDRRTLDIPDVENASAEMEVGRKNFLGSGYRAATFIPLMRGETAIGALSVVRVPTGPLSEKQLAALKTYADQAVIAVENARLLSELRERTEDLSESLQQQTATADVLKVISRSTFDLQTVLQTLVESAARLCEGDKATITRQRGEVFYRAESYGFSPEFMDYVRDIPVNPERGTAAGRALLEGRAVHIFDVRADPEYTFGAQKFDTYRTALGVPMLREGIPIGVLTLLRSEVRPFTEKQIELVSTFADQAAIAIENVRLFEAEQQRTAELAKSLDDLRTAQDRLVQTEKLASLGQLTAGIAHEIKNPLNFVNNFSGVSVELIDELNEVLATVPADDKTRADIGDLAATLRANLDKIVQHGKRADSIVKNMLLHSREGSGERRPVDINSIVEESLNLAYHGARAEREGFNITLERSFDPAAGAVDLYPQEITRVLLNLITNGFYAAIKRQSHAGDGFEPVLAAVTKNLGDRIEIRIRDNGTGIAPEVKDKIFNPFFTTKPAGEGTGLGLSISHDIIVKQHAGSLVVDTEPGRFTEFRIILPRRAAVIAGPDGKR
jgi:two-component system, NtrC family, sensor kinase